MGQAVIHNAPVLVSGRQPGVGQEGSGHGAGRLLLGLPGVPAAGGAAGGEGGGQVVFRGRHAGGRARHAPHPRRGLP